jgi:hypothetical protein
VSSRLAQTPGARIGVRYLYTSLGFWVFFNMGVVLWHQRFEVFYFREPAILALTHLAALGWLTTGLMGVMYATLPATLGVRPKGLRMAGVQYWLQVVGVAGLVLTMGPLPYTKGRVVFGLLTLGALVIFAHNIAATIGRGKEWRLPEAHFVMAMFYLAITGLIGMIFIFYLMHGGVPQTMTHLKVHAAFAGLGWLALTLMGLTYKLLPLELGVDEGPQRWAVAASVLINLVFWGVFFSYAYDRPTLRIASALLGLAGVVCHTMQVRAIAQRSPFLSSCALRPLVLYDWVASRQGGRGGDAWHAVSLPYTWVSCGLGLATMLLGLLLTAGATGDSFAVEYAYGYAAGAGWFGLFVVGQTAWLLPLLLHDDPGGDTPAPPWKPLEFPGLVAGTVLVTLGLLVGVSLIVALGAAVNLIASLGMTIRSVRLCRAQTANPHIQAHV